MLIIIAGEYKSGKTVAACTFPKPATLLDFDNGFTSVENTKGKDGKLVVPDFKEIDVYPFYVDSYTDLDLKTPQEKGATLTGTREYTKRSLLLISKYNEIIKELFDGKKQAQTLIIDSLTSLFRVWKEAIMATNNVSALRIADYMTLEQVLFSQFIPSLKSLAGSGKVKYIVLIDHIMLDKDEISGKIVEFPVGPSANQGRALGKEFDEIWYQQSDNNDYKWRTKKTGFFQAGSRLDLPDPIKPATFQELSKYLRKEEK